MPWDGHELSVLGTTSGCLAITSGCLGPGWFKSMAHRMPIQAFCIIMAGTAIAMPMVVVPIRRKLGLPTNQYDASHPDCKFPDYEVD
mmetsp:Transcript_30618/g.45337  ORF Transcript_30618/g.45337 Transcript_30618/m.45337 type:complete len:87 (-) Transcript_30618:167-427(-)